MYHDNLDNRPPGGGKEATASIASDGSDTSLPRVLVLTIIRRHAHDVRDKDPANKIEKGLPNVLDS